MLLPFLQAPVLGFPKPPDYSVLSKRLAQLQTQESQVSCLLLDSMLPRQRVEIQFAPPVSTVLREIQRNPSERTLIVLGMDRKRGEILRRGVEVRIESMSPYRASHGYFSSHSLTPMRGFTAFDTLLVGGRRCELVSESCAWRVLSSRTDPRAPLSPPPPRAWRRPPSEPCFEARVRWLAECTEPGSEEDPEPCDCLAIEQAEALEPLVAEWTSLVREGQRERAPGQLQRILNDLGPMPEADLADERAFWTAALINPLPALGVASEVRPAVLCADAAGPRVEMVRAALAESIEKLKAMPPGPFEVEPPPGIRA